MHSSYLPSVHGNAIEAQGDYAAEFVALWFAHMPDRAKLMRQDDRLMTCAQDHADYLANREDMTPSLHIGRDNSAPNGRVRQAGYRLPLDWPDDANNVESASVNHNDAADAVARLLRSPAHRRHLLGDGGFAAHVVYAVACVWPFYVILICPEETE